MTRRIGKPLLPAVALMLWAGAAVAEMRLNFQPQETDLGHAIYNLHTIVLVICVVIFVGVFGAMFYSIVYHRKSVGHKAAHFHENTTVELIWTVVPFVILIGMAYPATKTLLDQRDTSAPDITIKVTGYQWKWQLRLSAGGDQLLQQAQHAARADRQPGAEGRALLAGSGQRPGGPGRQEGTRADHCRRRAARRGMSRRWQ